MGEKADLAAPRPSLREISSLRVFENDAFSATITTLLAIAILLLAIILVPIVIRFNVGDDHLKTPLIVVAALLGIAGMSAFALVPWIVFRVARIKATIAEGPVIAAQIVDKSTLEIERSYGPPKRIPMFHIAFQWNGEEYIGQVNCSKWFTRHPQLANLAVGDEVAVVIDRDDPNHFFIRDFFWS
jgi:hypothetical protein